MNARVKVYFHTPGMLVSEHEVPKIEVDLRKSIEAYVVHEVYDLLEHGSSASLCINDKVRLRFRQRMIR